MNVIVNVLLGLIGLGIVIFVHELGHFLAARIVGIGVDAFSLGWGPKVAGFRRGETEYRISAFPIGGYCLMKGENEFRAALENKSDTIPRDPGTFYGAAPWRRIVVSLAGPFANVVFAALVFIAVASIGYSVQTHENRIVLASGFPLDSKVPAADFPADRAGLLTGDRILSANGHKITDYYDLQEAITENSPGGRIGIYAWIEPLVASVAPGSSASLAGLQAGDRIVSLDGKAMDQVIGFLSQLKNHPETARIGIQRGLERLELPIVISWKDNGESNMGITFAATSRLVRSPNGLAALGDGLTQTAKTLSLTFRSLGLLVSKPKGGTLDLEVQRGNSELRLSVSPSLDGVNLMNSISGPARITWMVGNTASQSLGEGVVSGLAKSFDLLAFLSIGLFIMNLLPIPALDGGQILLFGLEALRRRPFKVLTIYRFQTIGAAVILAIFVLATVSDLIFFAG
jgi:regulator of sigma E protease